MYNTPGKAAAIHPSRGDALAFFAFRTPAVPDFDYRDTAQHKRLLTAAFEDGAWRVPELLRGVRAADDLYFDSVSQVRVRPWSRGRVALVGDAASCVSLFGDGSSLAMAGAFTLAEELAASPSDHRLAYRRYEARHRTLVDPGSATSPGRHRCSSRRRGPASRPGTWPPGCGRWVPPRAGCGAALPRGAEEPRTWSRR